MKKIFILILLNIFVFTGCSNSKDAGTQEKVKYDSAAENEIFKSSLAGNIYTTGLGNILTFYQDGTAAYDYQNMIGENHHYDYDVYIVEATDTELIMEVLQKEDEVNEKVYTEDSTAGGPEEMIYNISDDTVKFYMVYENAAGNSEDSGFKNSYGSHDTKCAIEACDKYIAPSGNTKYCIEHTAVCNDCKEFIDDSESYCAECIEKYSRPKETEQKEKCINCNGTGYVKYYYGESNLEAVLSGHDPYTFGECQMCHGTGY